MPYELDVVNIRMVKEPSWFSDKPLVHCKDVADLMSEKFGDLDRELFCILNVAGDGRIINANVVSIGTINSIYLSMREIFKSSILSNAAEIIAVHNHPSGNVFPSKDDMLMTQKLRQAGELMDIHLLDHVIVSRNKDRYFSFKEEGMLERDFAKELFRTEYEVVER